MDRQELNKAIEQTINDISTVKRQLARTTDPLEIRLLEDKLRGLEALQLQLIEKIG